VRDEARADGVADERRQVGRDDAHLLTQVGLERLAVLEKVDHARGKVADVEVVDRGDVGSHRRARGVEHVAREDIVVVKELSQVGQRVLGESRLVADERDDLGVLVVVGHELDELGEVPAVPLAHAHRERVDVLVELVQERDRLDDHVVGPVHVELDLGARVGVSESQLGPAHVARLEAGEELLSVKADATDDLERALGRVAVNVEAPLDGRSEAALLDAEDDAGLVGEVELEQALQELVHDALGDVVGDLERVRGVAERSERDELDHLAKLGDVIERVLHVLGQVTNLLVERRAEQGQSSSTLEEDLNKSATQPS